MSRKQTKIKKDRHRKCHVAVIGTGVLGRQVAILLAGIGVRSMSLYDPQRVLKRHLVGQGFFGSDQGLAKVDATADIAQQYHPQMELLTYKQRINQEHIQSWQSDTSIAAFICVNSLNERRNLWSLLNDNVQFYCEGSFSDTCVSVRSLVLPEPRVVSSYKPEIVPPATKTTSMLVSATLTASLMVKHFLRWQRGLPVINNHRWEM